MNVIKVTFARTGASSWVNPALIERIDTPGKDHADVEFGCQLWMASGEVLLVKETAEGILGMAET